MLFVLLLCLCSRVLCDDGDISLGLNIGNAIDVFANYGDLSQVMKVISWDYEDEYDDSNEPFREKNIRVFADASSDETLHSTEQGMTIMFCDNYEQLLHNYFSEFTIQGASNPWKAFMGMWVPEEISKALGIEHNWDPCCFVLVKVSRKRRTVKMSPLSNVTVKDYVRAAISNMTDSQTDFRWFMKSYGTHYIDSYVTGNAVYQVFTYKRSGYEMLKRIGRRRSDRLPYYFYADSLKQIGDIRVVSGNKTIESWMRQNLRINRHYIYTHSRPSLLKLKYEPHLVHELNRQLDDDAILGLTLKTMEPAFEDATMAARFKEMVENDLQLWDINS